MTAVFEIAARFALPGQVLAVEPLGGGLINATYLVVTPQAKGVLQRINRGVFPQPKQVMANLRRLQDHYCSLPTPGLRLPHLIPTRRGEDWFEDAAGECWRMLEYLDGVTLIQVATPAVAEALGRSLGRFHRLVAGLDPAELYDTLPGFHVTPAYLAALDRARSCFRGPVLQALGTLFDWIDRQRGWAAGLEQARQVGRLPLRIMHGDPKLDNLLFDPRAGQPLAWVDLDTVKPGLIHYDIGDCLRSACRHSDGRFDLELAEWILTGWLAEARGLLSAEEIRWVPDAIQLLPFELGVRFLTDYLEGNRYFKVTDREENLRRALDQFDLARDVRRQDGALRALWQALSAAPER